VAGGGGAGRVCWGAMRSFPKAKEAFSEGEKVSFGVHRLHVGDAREVLASFPEASVHLVVTSPPYWTLKRYEDTPGQLGHIEDYEAFLDELDRVWREVFRLLVPGGRLVIVVGDVAVARRRFGRHLVFPLHADIQVRCRKLGFDNLNPIIWHKHTNASLEVEGRGVFLGKPYEPGAIIKTEIEYILMQRKPGGYRKPTQEQREKSRLPKEDFHRFFRQIWDDIPGESTKDLPPGARRAPGADVQLRGGRGLRPLRRDRDHPHRRGEVGEEGFGRGARAAVRSAGQRALCQGSSWVFPGGLGWSHPSSPLG